MKRSKKSLWVAIPAIGTMVATGLTVAALYFFDADSVYVNLLTEAVGVVATVMILDAIWKQREAKRLAPLRKAGVHDCLRAFREVNLAWYCIFFGVVRGPLTGRIGANFDAFASGSEDLSLDGAAEAIAPARSLGDHLVWQFEKFTKELDRTLTRFGPHLPPELIAAAQDLERSDLAFFVGACRTAKQLQGAYGQMRLRSGDVRTFVEQLVRFRDELRSFAEEHGVDAKGEGLPEELGAVQLKSHWDALTAIR
jgi:hypothetical protein